MIEIQNTQSEIVPPFWRIVPALLAKLANYCFLGLPFNMVFSLGGGAGDSQL